MTTPNNKPERVILDRQVRYVRYGISASGERGITWCVDENDTSPTQLDYASDCGRCWLGHSHTQNEHRRQLAVMADAAKILTL